MTDKVNSKDAMAAMARISREHAKVLEDAAGVLRSQADVLVLLAGEQAAAAEGITPPAAEPQKQTRQRKAPEPKVETTPAAPAVTIDDLKLLAQKVADAKSRDMVVAVLQRNGIQRFGDAKPDTYPKLKAELEAVLAGNDPTASNAADEW